jgi:hypothetical protein
MSASWPGTTRATWTGWQPPGRRSIRCPFFTNTWIVQPEDKGPGDYPSGGPEPHVLDLWRAGAPHIDFNAPDIYLPNFARVGGALQPATATRCLSPSPAATRPGWPTLSTR